MAQGHREGKKLICTPTDTTRRTCLRALCVCVFFFARVGPLGCRKVSRICQSHLPHPLRSLPQAAFGGFPSANRDKSTKPGKVSRFSHARLWRSLLIAPRVSLEKSHSGDIDLPPWCIRQLANQFARPNPSNVAARGNWGNNCTLEDAS